MPASTMNLSSMDKILTPAAHQPVTIIGIGAVGGYVAHGIAKMGVTGITVYDGDSVSSANQPVSIYRTRDIARPKTDALAEIIEDATGTRITANSRPFEGTEPLSKSVICCVDTMAARKVVWKAVKAAGLGVNLFIDTRIVTELIWVFAIDPHDPEDVELYEHNLRYDDEEVAKPACGNSAIDYVSKRAASAAEANLTRWWRYGTKKRLHIELAGSLEVIE
jgi:hypothetical protein